MIKNEITGAYQFRKSSRHFRDGVAPGQRSFKNFRGCSGRELAHIIDVVGYMGVRGFVYEKRRRGIDA
jgi:hypothetical protein